jgi:hypothetical protein
MNNQVKLTLFGIFLGILGNILGFLIYGLIFSAVNNVDFSMFFNTIFLKMESFRSQIITGSMLVNVVLFYFLMKAKKDAINRGVIITILLSVIAIIYYFA